ncbi:hypothetical protein Y1Q_0011562 [Alligator mississippiensis]|nr:hypothetical protein Y1Q_0011562 [Alligator mississippiensis]
MPQEGKAYCQQVLAKFCPCCHDQALVLEDVWTRRVALKQLVAEIREKQKLAWDSYEELKQLQASIAIAV